METTKTKVKTIFSYLEDINIYGLLYLDVGIFIINTNFSGNENIVHIY